MLSEAEGLAVVVFALAYWGLAFAWAAGAFGRPRSGGDVFGRRRQRP